MNTWTEKNNSLLELTNPAGDCIGTVGQFGENEWRGCYEPTGQRFKAPTREACAELVELAGEDAMVGGSSYYEPDPLLAPTDILKEAGL